ncbi:MAG: YndM family protein [Clostridia bacterium]|nr:YndM family protein [Clostridia bacterium]
MRRVGHLLTKFLGVTIILEISFLLFTNVSFGRGLFISLAVTVLTYIIEDQIILRRTNNAVATIMGAFITMAIILFFNYIYMDVYIDFSVALLTSVFLAVGEYVFHKYVADSGRQPSKR